MIHSPGKLLGPPTADLLARIQQQLKNLTEELDISRRPFLSAEQIDDVKLTTSETKVPHKLGRKLIGWQLADRPTTASVYRTSAADDKYLPLTASAAITVSLMVW